MITGGREFSHENVIINVSPKIRMAVHNNIYYIFLEIYSRIENIVQVRIPSFVCAVFLTCRVAGLELSKKFFYFGFGSKDLLRCFALRP